MAKCMSKHRYLHPQKLTVRCGLWAGKIIGQYIFKNDYRCRAMITNFFISELSRSCGSNTFYVLTCELAFNIV